MAALPPQPDFNLISHHFSAAAAELQKCPNIPALQQGDAILQALQRITGRLDTIDGHLRTIDGRLDSIDVKLIAMEIGFDRMEARIQAR